MDALEINSLAEQLEIKNINAYLKYLQTFV